MVDKNRLERLFGAGKSQYIDKEDKELQKKLNMLNYWSDEVRLFKYCIGFVFMVLFLEILISIPFGWFSVSYLSRRSIDFYSDQYDPYYILYVFLGSNYY